MQILTREMLNAGKSDAGGWSKKQLAIIGVAWPPPAGWQDRTIGKQIAVADYERFVAMRKTNATKEQPLATMLPGNSPE